MEKFKLELAGRELVVEIRDLAEQANGNVLVRYGDTMVLATCTMSKEEKNQANFFPLTVNYEERYYAAGKIKGARYIRRESRPSDEAICNSRLIDRTIRPRFSKDLKREVQIIVTVLSYDSENDPDIVGLIATSLALSISDVPWAGPIAAVRIGHEDNEFFLNPTNETREKTDADLIFAGGESFAEDSTGKKEKEFLINMIEGELEETEESLTLKSFEFSEKYLKQIIDFQKEIVKKIGKEKVVIEPPLKDVELDKEIKEFLGEKLEKILFQEKKQERAAEVDELRKDLSFSVEEKYEDPNKTRYALDLFEKETDRIIHEKAVFQEKRVDGRKLNEIRKIKTEVGILPRTHGSGLFCRGITKSLSILTLGTPGDHQLLEGMEIVGKKRFMHHYNFPPYSVGETRPVRGPGRRDIGHGILAEKALLPLIPPFDDFPYTIRVVSEILSSNGSTSMASVSSTSLALMDAGVPIKSPVSGIAIGLMQAPHDSKKYKILTDIQGPEDHHGDMDFKVAGTKKGMTAIQMDVKIEGITKEIFEKALKEAKRARLQILESMGKTLPEPRKELSPFAPKILTLQINPDKIRDVIGPGGRIINEIIDETGATIDIQQSGLVFITSEKEEEVKKAAAWVKNITREVKIGEVFQGKVKRILNFGAMVEILPGTTGLIHISKLAPHHVEKVEDIVKVGDMVSVKVILIDEQGRVNLSLINGLKK
ncbi:polyribonucleotide nucleotidyltransferase [Patescibacteria group bacterium]